MELDDTKGGTVRTRKFSWPKIHSIKLNNGQHLQLARTGSLNNIISGLKCEAEKSTDKRKRSNTVRHKKKKLSDAHRHHHQTPNMSALNLLSPFVAVPTKCPQRPYPTNASTENLKNGSGGDVVDARLRRRASSLDFLPEAIGNKSVSPQPQPHQNGSISKTGSPFARTTSMSQRSPFRKKLTHQDPPENSISGVREIRPKGIKRSKSGLDALFDAIERQEVNEVRRLINVHDVSINELNNEQFTALDIALMLNETEIATILLSCGARENPAFLDPEERLNHLDNLIKTAEENVNNYKTTLLNSLGDTKENERQLREWEWKLYLLKIMQSGFHSAETPSQPPNIVIAPLSSDSIVVNLNSSTVYSESKDIITKYKVEWSNEETFEEMLGHKLITDKRKLTCVIHALQKNTEMFVRVQAGNHKGFSTYGYPDPRSVKPSSWHECDNSVPRCHGVGDKLIHLVDDLLSLSKKQSDKSSDDGSDEETQQDGTPQIRSPKSKNPSRKLVKSMSKYTNLIFNSAPKLLKKIKGRGIYLAALLYNSDLTKVMVTMDENLPVVECDDNYAKSFSQEFYWFSKTSCTWEDIQHMLYFSTKSHSSQSVYIRRKLLQSALVLMNATGVNDLGPIHFRPFRDEHGSILLLAVNCIKKISSSRTMTMKWIPIQKLLKKTNSINDSVMVPERLIPSVQDQVTNHQRSRMKLSRGLYLGYLKLRTSVDTLSIIVPNSHSNVLPSVRIQDVPNVTKEQWEWLRSLNDIESVLTPTEDMSLLTFEKRIKFAIRKLFNALNVSPDAALSHRIYDHEIIELNSDVMFIIIFPSEVCTPPNQSDSFSSSNAYSALPVQAFEMNNMMTYQPKLMSSYCRLSSILELENLSIKQNLRETICHHESKSYREKQTKLSEFQQNVDDLWKVSRWIMDTLQACQDKNLNVGIPLTNLFKVSDWSDVTNNRLSLSSQQSDSSSDRDRLDSFGSNNQDRASSLTLKVYGTEEIGFSCPAFTQVLITEDTTARDVIETAVSQFLHSNSSSDSDDQEDSDACGSKMEAFRTIVEDDKLANLALVVVAGSRERVLRDDLILLKLQNPWEKGTLYLRLKKEALRATKWGLSTAV